MRKLLIILVLIVMVPVGLLAMSILAGSLYATTQEVCTESTSGFSGEDVLIATFGVDGEGEMMMEIRNGASSTVTIDSIELDGQNYDIGTGIGVGQSETVRYGSFEISEDCNDLDMVVTYELQDETETVTGTITGEIE